MPGAEHTAAAAATGNLRGALLKAPVVSAAQAGAEVYHTLKGIIKKKYGQDATNVGDEGGFAPAIASNEEGLNLVNQAIEVHGRPALDAVIAEMLPEGHCAGRSRVLLVL